MPWLSGVRNAVESGRGLTECAELANDEVYTRSHGSLSNRAYRYLVSEGRVSIVSEFLKEKFGLTSFQYIGCGDNVIVVRYTMLQALRIRAPAVEAEANTQRHIECPLICPVWREMECEGVRLNFVPYVPSLADAVSSSRVSHEFAVECIFSILRAGFDNKPPIWFYDHKNQSYKFEQVGLLEDCTPIIIDLGSVILQSDAPQSKLRLLAAHKMEASSRQIAKTPIWDGSWLDRSGRPKIASLPKPDRKILS